MKKAALLSALFHIILILLLIFGLPFAQITPELEQITAIPVELLPIAAVTQTPNPKPVPAPVESIESKSPQPLPNPEPVAQPEPTKPAPSLETVPPAPPEIKMDDAKALLEQFQVNDKPLDDKEIIPEFEAKSKAPPEIKKSAPQPLETKPVVTSKPVIAEKPKSKVKPKNEKNFDTSFEAVLKNIAKLKPSTNDNSHKDNKNTAVGKSGQVGVVGPDLTVSEIDAVRGQISKCWSMNSGAKDIDKLVIQLRILVNPDRTVRDVQIVNAAEFAHNPFYRPIAESAVRAVRNPQCSPLRLPEGKYDLWKDMTINFRPPV